jgi:hypothetical protein
LDFNYSVFGLSLRSNQAIPGVKPVDERPGGADVEIRLGSSPPAGEEIVAEAEALTFVSSNLDESGEPALRIWQVAQGAYLRLQYCDGMQFWAGREGKSVWATWPESASLEDAATYLLGPVLGLVLRLRGVMCLHASAVEIAGRAVAFVGDAGAGKSTTAAAFAHRGQGVISDDIVAVIECDGEFCVMPAYPYLSLWPESVKILYGSDKTLPHFSPNWEKRLLALAENHLRFEDRALALGAIFLLGERSMDASAPLVETLPVQEKLMALVANSYATRLLDQEMRAREFSLLGRLLSAVPVWRVRPHEDPARLDRLCEVISKAVIAPKGAPLRELQAPPPNIGVGN